MQLDSILSPFGYTVVPAAATGCLHLKTGCTYIGKNRILANRQWVDTSNMGGCAIVDVDPDEPFAANSLLIGETLLHSARFPRTRRLLETLGYQVNKIDICELEKAEAGLTCMSLIFEM
jgi:dimethylargininase